ncbi:hypothetical protein [Alteromonas sp. BMJM2]|uniref:hypothetical protein n=1 Tax=Alteromonas sp. BMJM2 TaxID=2954241 RepID=UPI0022B5600B|nr:hypothetical protein [Alteromonas sp. BMJM2]
MTTFNSLAELEVVLEKEPERKTPKKHNNAPRKKSNEKPKQSQSLATILESQTRVKAFHAIATLSIASKREDLQRILSADRLPLRLREYLKKIGVYDNNSDLTEKGLELSRTGTIQLEEKGLYQFWFCEHPLIGNQLIALQRLDALSPNIEGKTLGKKGQARTLHFINGGAKCSVFDKESKNWKTCHTEIKDIDVISEEVMGHDATLTWNLDANNSVELKCNVKVKELKNRRGNNHSNAQQNEIELPLSFKGESQKSTTVVYGSVADYFEGEWIEERLSIQLPFSEKIDDFAILNACKIRDLPAEPLNIHEVGKMHIKSLKPFNIEPTDSRSDQQIWLQTWLKGYFTQRPVSPLQAEKDQLLWRSKKQLAHLDIPPIGQKEILDLLAESGRGRAYWNAAATIDLIPSQTSQQGIPLTLQSGDSVTPQRLLQHLTNDRVITRMFISDRYYRTDKQEQLLNAIANTCPGKLLTARSSETRIQPHGWSLDFFEKSKPENHDRYWIIETSQNEQIWKVSTSLDFLRQQPNDEWEVAGYPTFTPMSRSDLPEFLLKYLEKN